MPVLITRVFARLLVWLIVATVMFSAGCISSSGLEGVRGSSPVSYRRPPRVHRVLATQPSLVVCAHLAQARTMAETGFLLPGCKPLQSSERWRVVNRHHERLDEGGSWFARVRGAAGGVGWVPVPWHDWV